MVVPNADDLLAQGRVAAGVGRGAGKGRGRRSGHRRPRRTHGRELFRQRVRPMLEAKCLGCHGDGEELEGALDLRNREAMLRGGKSGPALRPRQLPRSLIYQTLLRTDERMMPPKDRDRLSAEEIDALKTWIDDGAPGAPD